MLLPIHNQIYLYFLTHIAYLGLVISPGSSAKAILRVLQKVQVAIADTLHRLSFQPLDWNLSVLSLSYFFQYLLLIVKNAKLKEINFLVGKTLHLWWLKKCHFLKKIKSGTIHLMWDEKPFEFGKQMISNRNAFNCWITTSFEIYVAHFKLNRFDWSRLDWLTKQQLRNRS